jgi:hypothetical protein
MVTNWDLRARVMSIAAPNESAEQQANRHKRYTEYRDGIAEVQRMVRDEYLAASLRETAISLDHRTGVTKGDRAQAADKAKFYLDISNEELLPLSRGALLISKAELLGAETPHLACRPLEQRLAFWKRKLVTPDGVASYFRHMSGTVDTRQVACILDWCVVLTIRYRAAMDVPGLRKIWNWRLPLTCEIIHMDIHIPRHVAYALRHQHALAAIRMGVKDDIKAAEAAVAIRKLDDRIQASRYPSWRDVPVLLVRGRDNTQSLSEIDLSHGTGPDEESDSPIFG